MDPPSTAHEPIAIVGMALRVPGADSPATFWENLLAGRSMLDLAAPLTGPRSHAPVARLAQVDGFDGRAFGIPPNQARDLDPQHRLLLELAWEAIEDAGIDVRSLAGRKVAVFVGVQWNDYQRLQTRDPQQARAYAMTGNLFHFAAHRISHVFGLRGPSMVVDMGCASALAAVHQASQALRLGEAELAIAGGVELVLSADGTAMMSDGGLLDTSGAHRTFDAHGAGFSRGEGAALVVLKRSTAGDRVYASLAGSSVNHNGSNHWITAPSASAQSEVLREAWSRAKVTGRELGYVEMHGTASPSGDATEAAALGEALGPDGPTVQVGSVKSLIGHLGAASGIVALAKVALALWHDTLPPGPNVETLNPQIDLDALGLAVSAHAQASPWPEGRRRAGVTAISLSGANAHAVLVGCARAMPRPSGVAAPWPLIITALSGPALQASCRGFVAYLKLQHPAAMVDIAYSSCARRAHHRHRILVEGRTIEAWIAGLENYLAAPDDWRSDHPFVQGAAFDAGGRFPQDARVSSLPAYPWQRRSFWSTAESELGSGRRTEDPIVDALATVLGLDEVPSEVSPVSLGLDSLAALRVSHLVAQRTGEQLSVPRILGASSVGALRDSSARDLPVTAGQAAFLFHQALAPSGSAHHVVLPLALEGAVDTGALRASFARVVRRHPLLRAVFVPLGDGYAHRVGDAMRWSELDLGDCDEPEMLERLARDAEAPFDLAADPPLRVVLVTRPRAMLLIVAHHIAIDFWSLAIVLAELAASYAELTGGPRARLEDPGASFAAFAAGERRASRDATLSFWRRTLAGAPPLCTPRTDRPRPAVLPEAGATHRFAVDAAITRRLRAMARAEDVTLFMALAAGLFLALQRRGAGDDLVLGTPTARREDPRFSKVVGYFVNPVPLRVKLPSRACFRDVLALVRSASLAAFANQDHPFPALVEQLGGPRDRSHNPIFQVMFALQQSQLADRPELSAFALCDAGAVTAMGELRMRTVALPRRSVQFDLNVQLAPRGDELTASIEYNLALFDESTVEALAQDYLGILEAMARDPDAPCEAAARSTVDAGLGAFAPATRDQTPIISAILARMRARGDAVAVRGPTEDAHCSHRELLMRVELWRGRLVELRSGQIAAVCLDTSEELVAAALAVMSRGGVLLFLDPAQPAARRDALCKGAGATVLINATGVRRLGGERRLDGLAYVMYTSGSTGQPKGVMVDHAGLRTQLSWRQAQYPLHESDAVLLLASPAFDIFIWELLGPLLAGACLVIPPQDARHDTAQLTAYVVAHKVSVVQMVSSALGRMLDEPAFGPGLRLAFCGGDTLDPQVVRRFLQRSEATLVHLYGPTEAVIDASSHVCVRDEGGVVPIGRAADGLLLSVVDAELRPVAPGVRGQIAISGPGLSLGYLGQGAQTAERFVPSPTPSPGRTYLSGDLGRVNARGELEFLGRFDDQVKVRGYRVELGEVEAALGAHPQVGAWAVTPVQLGDTLELVAWVAARASAEISQVNLHSHLAAWLPGYMVPARIVVLPELPRLPSGKVDRGKLQAMGLPQASGGAVSGTGSYAEDLVVEAWRDALGRDIPSRGSNFFELGGHSLLALRAASRLSALSGVEVPVRAVFDHPTARGLATWLGARFGGAPSSVDTIIPRRPTALDAAPLSSSQEGLWLVTAIDPQSLSFTIPEAYQLRGALDAERLVTALGTLVERHEILRARLEPRESSAVIRVDDAVFTVTRTDVSGEPEPQRALEALIQVEERRGFAPERGELFRAHLVRLGPDAYALLLNTHHLVCDGWSQALLLDELGRLYGRETLVAPALQYADYACWEQAQRETRRAAVLGHWRQRLVGARSTPLPMARAARPDRDPAQGGSRSASFRAATAFAALCRAHEATPFMGWLACAAMMLHRYSGAEDIVIGSPVALRDRPQLDGVVGLFVNLLPFRIELRGDPSFAELIARAKRTALDAYAHRDAALGTIVRALDPVRVPGEVPLVSVVLQLATQTQGRLRLADVEVVPLLESYAAAPPYLNFTLTPSGDAVDARCDYDGTRFDAATVDDMLQWLARCAEAATGAADSTISALLRGLERSEDGGLEDAEMFAFEREDEA